MTLRDRAIGVAKLQVLRRGISPYLLQAMLIEHYAATVERSWLLAGGNRRFPPRKQATQRAPHGRGSCASLACRGVTV